MKISSTKPEKRDLLLKIPIVVVCFLCFCFDGFSQQPSSEAHTNMPVGVFSANKTNETTITFTLSDKNKIILDFYAPNIFRLFSDQKDSNLRDPDANPPAKILVDNPRKKVENLTLSEEKAYFQLTTEKIIFQINKANSLFKIIDRRTNALVVEEAASVEFGTTLRLKEHPTEHFFGGGMQNGRFSHKGKAISIVNENVWTDGGVASPNPFFWSTNGYGLLWHTFAKGKYDFGAKEKDVVKISHETNYLDVFFMIDKKPASLLADFYQLTGNPVLLPKFGFYEGHLNAYNRDFWKENEKGILFEDGKKYSESQKDNGGIKESLNGEKDNYQFSARAVIDRYKKNDMPLGWILPNDGYGAGYGQTESLEGNIENLKSLGDYARKNGVEMGLWTQSDLYPKPGINALLQRDILKEVQRAGVRVLKTDVAWVGAGYSFGLNGVSDVARIMSKFGNNSRPFIISLDGWAGTQRYAAIWSGDQTGGNWEYIRFHIPTYLGSGLSGQPNVGSDMDGIFGGKNWIVNTRDFQWKTFTPMQLNMDGWGANEKYPHALGEPAASINRFYLKLKSELLPYTYSIAKEAIAGLPMVRAIFLDEPNSFTLGLSTQYQFMFGPFFLVAPIFQATKTDGKGNDIRDGIYLPEGTWFDYFTGEKYSGGLVINNIDAPIWKLPVFVKAGAIIPMSKANNNVSEINKGFRKYELYPAGRSFFEEYDDDGRTEAYKAGIGTKTSIESNLLNAQANITIYPTTGDYIGFEKNKVTELVFNVTKKPGNVLAWVGGKPVKLTTARSEQEFQTGTNVFYYDPAPPMNTFGAKDSAFAHIRHSKNPQLKIKLGAIDVSANLVKVTVEGFEFAVENKRLKLAGELTPPLQAQVLPGDMEAFTLRPSWKPVKNADYYEIDFNGMRYSTIRDTALIFENLAAETKYNFRLRAVNKAGASEWISFDATTKSNPLQFAIRDIRGESTAKDQEGSGIELLFDFDEKNMWHSQWGKKAVPFDLVMDLQTINQLDKLAYLPRAGRGNGTIRSGAVFYSNDKENWVSAGSFNWALNDSTKIVDFPSKPVARYVKLSVTEGVGGFGSGRELYVFKVPFTDSKLPGDINNDRKVDHNDLVSYINYNGLRLGDPDFEGYISNGDINKNNLIDAYDISVVATKLEGGIDNSKIIPVTGSISLSVSKNRFDKNEDLDIVVKGHDLNGVNAISFALPYNAQEYEFTGIQVHNMKTMENLSTNRTHANGNSAVYLSFVNIGEKQTLSGSDSLFTIKLRPKKRVEFDLKAVDGFLVGKDLKVIKF